MSDLLNLGGRVATVAGLATMGVGQVSDKVGTFSKTALSKIGLDLTEKQSALALGGLVAAVGGLAWLMSNRNKGDDESEITPPSTPTLPGEGHER